MGVSHISQDEGEHCKALNYIRELHRLEWESEEDIPYKESIYKVIDRVVEYQIDRISDMELEDFYRVQMQKYYEDKRNTVELANEWTKVREAYGGTRLALDGE